MITNTTGVSVKETISGIWALIKKKPQKKIKLKFSHSSSAAYIKKVKKGSWESLVKQSKTELTEHKKEMEKLYLKQRELDKAAPMVNGISSAFNQVFKPMFSSSAWQDIRTSIIKRLVKKGKSEFAARKMVKRVEKLNSNTVEKTVTISLDSSMERLSYLVRRRQAAEMGSVISLAVARFNQYTKDPVNLRSASEFCTQSRKEILTALRNVWNSLRNEKPAELAINSGHLSRLAADKLTSDALKYSAAVSVKRKSSSKPDLKNDRLALELGELNRLLLFSIALGKKLIWIANAGTSSAELKEWTEQAGKLDFDSPEKNAKQVSISALLSKPSLYANKFLAVEGTLGNIVITHIVKKAISTADIKDTSGKSVTLVLPYIKLDSGGIVGGSYVSVSGIWKVKSKENGGKPALEIDRLSLKDLGRKSWLRWAEYMVTTIYQRSPHAVNAKWSWETGSNGAANQIRYNTWFNKKEVRHGM